jgi:hypothetical protein
MRVIRDHLARDDIRSKANYSRRRSLIRRASITRFDLSLTMTVIFSHEPVHGGMEYRGLYVLPA